MYFGTGRNPEVLDFNTLCSYFFVYFFRICPMIMAMKALSLQQASTDYTCIDANGN